MQNTPTFTAAFRFWAKLGLISFGGPAGQIAIMERELVEQRKWIDKDEFLHALNYCMLLPGPEAQQLATYCGWKLHGVKGGIAAGTLFVFPSILILLALSWIYVHFGSVPQVEAVLGGFKAVVVAIIVDAVIKIGKRSLKTNWHIAVAALAFCSIFFFKIPFPLIILSALVFGFFYSRYSVSDSVAVDAKPLQSPIKPLVLKAIAAFVVLWSVPILLLLFVYGSENLSVKLYLFFTQSAFVTFGGAYAVLAYVNQAVVANGWVTATQAIDGLALAETTPGPLIMVLQFIGFTAGWNATQSTPFAILCGLLTTYVTFLPSFLFIFAGAGHIERLRSNRKLTTTLSFVTAAVCGVILNLAFAFGLTVIFQNSQFDWFAAGLSIITFAALHRFKIDILWVLAFGGFCGLLWYFLVLG